MAQGDMDQNEGRSGILRQGCPVVQGGHLFLLKLGRQIAAGIYPEAAGSEDTEVSTSTTAKVWRHPVSRYISLFRFKTNIQGHNHIHSCGDHFINTSVTYWSRIGVWRNPEGIP